MTGTFLNEVGAGSREENASKQKLQPGSNSIRTEEAPMIFEAEDVRWI